MQLFTIHIILKTALQSTAVQLWKQVWVCGNGFLKSLCCI